MRQYLIIVAVCLGCGLAGYGAGRYFGPTKIKTVEKENTHVEYVDSVAWMEKRVEVQVAGKTRTIVIEKRPDGSSTTHIDEKQDTKTTTGDEQSVTAQENGSVQRETKQEIVESFSKPDWRASLHAGWRGSDLKLRPNVYGGELSRRILGPFWLGAWGNTDQAFGISGALEW